MSEHDQPQKMEKCLSSSLKCPLSDPLGEIKMAGPPRKNSFNLVRRAVTLILVGDHELKADWNKIALQMLTAYASV